MLGKSAGVVACLAAGLVSDGASAAGCPQERAIYADRGGLYRLSFAPVGSDAATSTHRFTLVTPGDQKTLDGFVMGSDPVLRTVGMVFDHCPDGDVTGTDLAACTVWEGVIYGQSAEQLDLLPDAKAQAAEQILLAGFGPAFAASKAGAQPKAPPAPWDVFSLKGCSG